MGQTYREKTKGAITASKMKAYMKSPAYYYFKFIAMASEQGKEGRHFALGTFFHELLELGLEARSEKYWVQDGFQKKHLIDLLVERYSKQDGVDDLDVKAKRKILERPKVLLQDLREERYGVEQFGEMQKKVAITNREANEIIAMYKSLMQNPVFDTMGECVKEKRREVGYKGLKLTAQLDRTMFFSIDDSGVITKRYSLEEIDELLLGKERTEQKKIISDLRIRCQIRDWKTTANLKKLKDQLKFNQETQFQYVMSMAFYYLIVNVKYALEAEVVLDCVEKVAPYVVAAISIPTPRLKDTATGKILPVLDEMLEAQERFEAGDPDAYPEPTIEEIIDNNDLREMYEHYKKKQTSFLMLDVDYI